jgi:septal ring factor EnvC (AmiA/AmiB activator)
MEYLHCSQWKDAFTHSQQRCAQLQSYPSQLHQLQSTAKRELHRVEALERELAQSQHELERIQRDKKNVDARLEHVSSRIQWIQSEMDGATSTLSTPPAPSTASSLWLLLCIGLLVFFMFSYISLRFMGDDYS